MEYNTVLAISREEFLEIYKDTPLAAEVDLFYSPLLLGIHNRDSRRALGMRRLKNKLSRMNMLYYIKDKQGRKVLFKMNRGQHIVYAEGLKHPRLIVLKSRQVGISTLQLVRYFDDVVTLPNIEVGLVSHGLGAAELNLEKIKFLWDNLNPAIKGSLRVINNNTKGFALSNGTKIYVKGTFRGATLHRLHVSEYGKIAAEKKDMAEEIKSGTLQAVAHGNPVVFESTAEGPNDFMTMWNNAERTQSTGLFTEEDFKPVFLSWLDDPENVQEKDIPITTTAEEYFEQLRKRGHKITKQQINWWVKKEALLKERVYKEFPADPQDAFRASQSGAYYAKIYDEFILKGNRIKTGLFDPGLDIYLTMDIGYDDFFVLCYFQLGPNKEVRIIDEYINQHMDIKHYAEYILANKFKNAFGEDRIPEHIYFPHDAGIHTVDTGKTRVDIFGEHGVTGELLDPEKVNEGIELTREMLRNCWFEEHCTGFLDAICNYKKEYSPRLGRFLEKPKHDDFSHPADALRYAAHVVDDYYGGGSGLEQPNYGEHGHAF